jgi:hypothetical protein
VCHGDTRAKAAFEIIRHSFPAYAGRRRRVTLSADEFGFFLVARSFLFDGLLSLADKHIAAAQVRSN